MCNPACELPQVQAADRLGPSLPEYHLLEEFAPRRVWEKAFAQAERSPLLKFKMGAVIYDPKRGELATGCAHMSDQRYNEALTTHAERHALIRASHLDLTGTTCVIISLNKRSDGCPWSSAPCVSCLRALINRGVKWVIYPERGRDGAWTVKQERSSELIERGKMGGVFAREQRVTLPGMVV